MSSFKDDLKKFMESKGKVTKGKDMREIPTRRSLACYKKPIISGRNKPMLFDPEHKDGPVKVYTREEIEAYEAELSRQEGRD